ncbi:hypothetical protein ACH47Z_18105 [Streptomyces sp. NPDC020192]|uniref:hypothetical protein n=1 Tax=Streptomyces sp. NPDC020192 TaxID=3365066 RepID=UPI0037A7F290
MAAAVACAARSQQQRSTTAEGSSVDLDAAFARIPDLDDGQLRDLVDDLDTALRGCRGGLLDDTDRDLISVAAAARIALRRREASAGRRRAADRVRQLTSTETTE